MRILIPTNSASATHGGGSESMGEIARILTGMGHQVTLFCSDRNAGDLQAAGVEVVFHEPFKLPTFMWRLWLVARYRFLRQQMATLDLTRFDLVWSGNTFYLSILSSGLAPKLPVVYSPGAVIGRDELRSYPGSRLWAWVNAALFHRYQRRLMARAQLVVSHTQSAEQRRAQVFDLSHGRTLVAPLGVDCERFQPSPADPALRQALGIPEGVAVIVSAGRLIGIKQMDLLLDAFAGLADQQVHLLILGEGEQRPQLEAQIQRLGVAERVHLAGHVTDVAAHLVLADLFALPSSHETFGLVYVQAMACGLPVIGRDYRPPEILSNAREVIAHGQCGYVVDGMDDLRQRLDELLSDADLRARMGQAARQRALDHFGWSVYVKAVLAALPDDLVAP